MALLRRLFGVASSEEKDQAVERERQYAEIQRGLHEAAQRVHYLEIEAQLRARGLKRQSTHQNGASNG